VVGHRILQRAKKSAGTADRIYGGYLPRENPWLQLQLRQHVRSSTANGVQQRTSAARYSITSSAVDSKLGGTAMLSPLAAFMLMTKSNFVGCSTGSSVGFAPLRMRPQ
jgi:hypothetical protein